MWLADNPEWRYTAIVVASCIAFNSTLPIWLRLAKIYDDRKSRGKAESLEDSDAESESDDENDDNAKGSRKNSPIPAIDDDSSIVSNSQYSIVSSMISSQITAVLEARPRRPGGRNRGDRKQRRCERDIRFAAGMQKFKLDRRFDPMEVDLPNGNFSDAKSVMSKLSVDDVSMNDGVDEKQGVENMFDKVDTPYERRSCWQVVLEVSDWDSSMASLASLTGFYMVQELTINVASFIEVAVISHMIGIAEADAFIMVSFLLEIAGIFSIGFQEAICILVPQADGSNNDLMVGRYLQIGIVFTILSQIPGSLLWSFYMYDTVIWFGFNERTALIAQNYTYSILIMKLANDVNECFFSFFDVMDREIFVTVYKLISECTSTGVIVAMAYFGVPNMVAIGLTQSLVELTLLFVNIIIVVNNGWLDDYSEGLVKTFGLKDWRAMRTTFVTAVPLAVCWFLVYGEWQVMVVFARSIGKDEVAAWNILGYIWDVFEAVTEAISGAAGVRVGFLMGAGKPQQARKISEKSVYVGIQFAVITVGLLFVLAEFLPSMLTPNLEYQKLIFDQIPLIGFGGILMVPGFVIEGIFCAQGRVRLMTTIEIIVSWFISMPVAAIFVYCFNSSIEGLVSGLVVGYSSAATLLLFYFLRSNWEQLSEMVMQQNAAEGLQYFDTEWDELPHEVQKSASTLGYTKVMWESNREPDSTKKSWKDLTEAERTAAVFLGYNEKKWNGAEDGEQYNKYDFDDLPTKVKEAAKLLGFTSSIWDNDEKIPIQNKDWVNLTAAEQSAAYTLRYTKEKWENESDSSSSSSDNSVFQAIKAMPDILEEKVDTPTNPKEKVVDYDDFADNAAPWDEPLLSCSCSTISETCIPSLNEGQSMIGNRKCQNSRLSVTKYGDYRFEELPSDIQQAALVIGFTRSTWDRNLFIPRKSKTWDRLTPKEMIAALSLGCTEEKWEKLLDSW